jgi:hypothetical protein
LRPRAAGWFLGHGRVRYQYAFLISGAKSYERATNSDNAWVAGANHSDPNSGYEPHVCQSLCGKALADDPGDNAYASCTQSPG